MWSWWRWCRKPKGDLWHSGIIQISHVRYLYMFQTAPGIWHVDDWCLPHQYCFGCLIWVFLQFCPLGTKKSPSFICSYQCPGDKLRIYRNISLSKSGTSQYTLGMCLDRHVSTRFSFRDPGNGRKTVDRLEGEKWPKICRNWISSSFLSILLCVFFFLFIFQFKIKVYFFLFLNLKYKVMATTFLLNMRKFIYKQT